MFLAVAPSESVVLTHVTEHAKLLPGKAHSPAGSVGVTEDASGNGLAEGLQHVLQLLLVHGHGQVWDVKVGGVLLLLLNGEKQGEDSRMRIRTSPFKKKTKKKRGAIEKAAGRNCVRCTIVGWAGRCRILQSERKGFETEGGFHCGLVWERVSCVSEEKADLQRWRR